MRCEAELCPHWTGQGCICAVLDLDGDAPFVAAGPPETEIRVVPESAVAEAVAAERERCAQLAEQVNARYGEPHPVIFGRSSVTSLSFADLLRESGHGT